MNDTLNTYPPMLQRVHVCVSVSIVTWGMAHFLYILQPLIRGDHGIDSICQGIDSIRRGIESICQGIGIEHVCVCGEIRLMLMGFWGWAGPGWAGLAIPPPPIFFCV